MINTNKIRDMSSPDIIKLLGEIYWRGRNDEQEHGDEWNTPDFKDAIKDFHEIYEEDDSV